MRPGGFAQARPERVTPMPSGVQHLVDVSPRVITYVQYTNPAAYPPLEHSSAILAENGWQVHFLGCSAYGAANGFKMAERAGVSVTQLQFPRPGLRQKMHYFGFAMWVLWHTWRSNARWVYASDALAAIPAGLAALLLRRAVVYHEHDVPPRAKGRMVFRVVRLARSAVARNATEVVVPNRWRGQLLTAEARRRSGVRTILNSPRRAELAFGRRNRDRSRCRLFFHGSINAARLPLAILEALQRLPESVDLRFAGYTTIADASYLYQFLQEASRLGLGTRVGYLGAPSTRSELLALCATASVGLAFMPRTSNDDNMRTMAGASNKPFDYLACGLNVVVSNLPDWVEMFVATGCALACDPSSPDSIATAVRFFVDNPAAAEQMRETGRRRLETDWNYDQQFRPLRMQLEAKLHASSGDVRVI